MTKRISLLVLSLTILGLTSSCSSAGSSRAALMAQMDLSTLVPIADALAIGQAQVPGGVPAGVELELDDDDENEPPAWEASFFDPASGQIIEVEIHAMTGQVLGLEVEDDGDECDD